NSHRRITKQNIGPAHVRVSDLRFRLNDCLSKCWLRSTEQTLHDDLVEHRLWWSLVQSAGGQYRDTATVRRQNQRHRQRSFDNILEQAVQAIHDEEYRQL